MSESSASSRSGRVVGGRFRLVARLGSGAAGSVWRAQDGQRGGEVALKLLHDHDANPTRVERFRREAELTRALSHPGIVGVVDAGWADGVPFIAYELVQGAHTLQEVLPLAALRRRVELVRDVARAVGVAHARGIVHRDLKLQNVLVDLAGQPRVADFGLASAQGLERLTATGAAVGTPAAMSPEQVFGGEVGAATDVWALGVMLYQALTGGLPFLGATWQELGQAIGEARPRAPRELRSDVPRPLEETCLRALQADPALRPADGEAFARELDVWLLAEASTASGSRPAGEAPPATRQRGSLLALLLGGPALVAVPLLAWHLPRRGPATPSATPAPTPSAVPPVASAAGPVSAASPTSPPPGAPATPPPPTPAGRGLPELQAAAEAGDLDGMVALGEALLSGREAPPAPEAAAEWFRRAAEAGSPRGMRLLGRAFERGQGVARDLELAASWFERAARAGEVEAMVEMGLLLELRHKRPAEAVAWYRRAAEAGSPRGKCCLGVMLQYGLGVPADPAAALPLFREAVDGGWVPALVRMGRSYEQGRGVPKDEAASATWYQRAAEAGDAEGMRMLGEAYDFACGLPRDDAQAVRWYRRAADLGDVPAMGALAKLLESGRGGPKDAAEAEAWYRRAVERGSVAAMNNYGVSLATGRLGRVDEAEAVRLFRRAAEGGDATAQQNLGVRLLEGKGLPRDLAEAVTWLRRSAEQGNAVSQLYLGRLARDGEGVPRDPAAALDLFRRAARRGNVEAMLELGRLLQRGPPALRDAEEARRWLERAAREGNAEAKQELERE